MWAVSQPQSTTADTAQACVKGVRNAVLRKQVHDAIPDLVANRSSYEAHAASATLHTTGADNFPVNELSDDEMKELYSGGLLRRKDGRRIYDRIMAGARHGRCSYCQHGQARSLDHFAPRDQFPTLAIEPLNLIPSCMQCNHQMSSAWGSAAEEEFLHPYFMPAIGRWLFAAVERTSPITVRFEAVPTLALLPAVRDRVLHQFKRLGLGSMYSVISTQELVGLSRRLPDLGDERSIRQHLLEIAGVSFAADINDRRGVLFEALANDNWYCREGFARG